MGEQIKYRVADFEEVNRFFLTEMKLHSCKENAFHNGSFDINSLLGPERTGKCDMFVAARLNNEIVGAVASSVNAPRAIHTIYVSDEHRKHGIGFNLLLKSVRYFHKNGSSNGSVYIDPFGPGMDRLVKELQEHYPDLHQLLRIEH